MIHKTQAPKNRMQRIPIYIIESERGWGQKVDDVVYADTPDEAAEYIKNYNKENNLEKVPDWYMYARL